MLTDEDRQALQGEVIDARDDELGCECEVADIEIDEEMILPGFTPGFKVELTIITVEGIEIMVHELHRP